MSNGRSAPFGLFERMLAGRYLRAKRAHGGVALISVISVVAITLAVMALIITMSVMNGFRETLLSRILGVNGHVYIDVHNMPDSEIQRLAALSREAPDVLHVAPIINAQALATSPDGMAAGVIVRGIARGSRSAADCREQHPQWRQLPEFRRHRVAEHSGGRSSGRFAWRD